MQKLLPAHQRKWGGGIIPSPKSGGPIPLSPPALTPIFPSSKTRLF